MGVTSVALYVDGTLSATDNTSPYTFSLNTASLSNANHILSTKAYDAAGNVGTSATVSVTVSNGVVVPPTPTPTPTPTPNPTPTPSGGGGGGGTITPPSFGITSVSLSNITSTGAKITVTTHVPGSIVVKYGPTTLYGNATQASPLLTTNYVSLSGLTPGTVYDFVIIASPQSGTALTSENYTFTTTGNTASGGGGTAGTPSPSPVFTSNISYSDKGPEVILLQNILHAQGFLAPNFVTGYFGTQTEHAILLFQSAHDLNKSGFVDIQTQTLLNKIALSQGTTAGVTETIPTPSSSTGSLTRNLGPGSRGPDVTILQHILAKDGDYTGTLFSTYYGSVTQRAVQAFQTKYGIVSYGTPRTTGYGAVGARTRAKMGGM